MPDKQKQTNLIVELLLCVFLGCFGAHRFYVGKIKSGLAYFFTIGLFGFGWIFDIIALLVRLLSGRKAPKPETISLMPAEGHYLAYKYDDVKFYPPAEIISKVNKKYLQPGAEIHLIQEPKNKYDSRAVALYISGNKIGYLLKGTLQDMANDYIESGWPIRCVLSGLKFSGGEYKGYVHLFFYRKSTKPKLKGYSDIDIHSFVPTDPEATPNTPLTKKNIVFSGVFNIPLEEIMQIAVDAGAVLKTRASKSVDYLVVGAQNSAFVDENGMSSKEATATKLNEEGIANIKIISEQTFMELARIDLSV